MPQRAVTGLASQGTLSTFWVVRGGGLEPPQYCYRQDLNLVRLPISPPAQKNSATRRSLRNTLKVLAGVADRWKSVSQLF